MKIKIVNKILNLLFMSIIISYSYASDVNNFISKINILDTNLPSNGYFFISSEQIIDEDKKPYISIIDNMGVPVLYKELNDNAHSFSVKDNNYLAYIMADTIFIMDSSFICIDTVVFNSNQVNNNDFIVNEDNSVLVATYEERVQDLSGIIENGSENATILESVLIYKSEFEEKIIWNSLDNFNFNDVNFISPLVNFNSEKIDYIGLVDFEYDSDTTVLLCCQFMDEITKINIKTGEVIWRLGGKENEFEFLDNSTVFSHQSCLQRLTNGNLVIFDNGLLHEIPVSSVIEYEIDEENKTIKERSRYFHKERIVVEKNASARKINNGNIVVSWGDKTPSLTEFYENGLIALELDYSGHSYGEKITKSNWKTNLFSPVVNTVDFGMWDYTIYRYLLPVENKSSSDLVITSTTNFSEGYYIEESFPIIIGQESTDFITINYYPETISIGIVKDVLTINVDNENQRIAQQVNLIGYRDDFTSPTLSTTPKHQDVNVSVDSEIYIDFGEPLRNTDDTEMNNTELISYLSIKKGSIIGEEVNFNATLNSNKDLITIKPSYHLDYNEEYFVELNYDLEDYYNNVLNATSFSFTTESSSGIVQIDDSVKIYPNPFENEITVLSMTKKINSVEVVDIMGKKMCYKSKINSYSYNFKNGNIKQGIYLLIIKFNDNTESVVKILKK